MWTGRILLLVLLLLTGGGWFDALMSKRRKIALLCAIAVVFGLTLVPTLKTPSVRVCFAPCAFALCAALLCPTNHPIAAALAALFGGFLGFKLCDALPLFFEQGLLIAAAALVCTPLCRDRNAKTLAIAAAPLVMLMFRMAGDYALFRSTVLELGTGDALCAQTVGLLVLLAAGTLMDRLWTLRQRRLQASA